MDIEMFDIYECVSNSIRYTTNKGYREEQIQRRKTCERNVLASLKSAFPDVAEHFGIKNFKDNAGEADFGVTYKGEQLLRVGTETASIYRQPYKVKYEFGGLCQDDICKHYEIKNIEFMPVEEVLQDISEYGHILKRRELIREILKLEQNLAGLKKELEKENKFLDLNKQKRNELMVIECLKDEKINVRQ